MNTNITLHSRLLWLLTTLDFCKKHFSTLFMLGLAAAIGRSIQLRAIGEISVAWHVTLEVLIEATRVFIFLYALGTTQISKGITRLKTAFWLFFRKHPDRIAVYKKLRSQWLIIVVNLLLFSCITFLINFWIRITVFDTCFYERLTKHAIISKASSEWVMILFLKNISVIPLTLVFIPMLLLFLANKIKC